MAKRVYLFNEGSKDDRDLLGGKGANLCEMTSLGLPVPSALSSPPAPAASFSRRATSCPPCWSRNTG